MQCSMAFSSAFYRGRDLWIVFSFKWWAQFWIQPLLTNLTFQLWYLLTLMIIQILKVPLLEKGRLRVGFFYKTLRNINMNRLWNFYCLTRHLSSKNILYMYFIYLFHIWYLNAESSNKCYKISIQEWLRMMQLNGLKNW